jgi:structural maintenance of chromosome 2
LRVNGEMAAPHNLKMHIRELVLDGFKTYAHRTVIQGFDLHFNAITGMNGSGKSNILDSIRVLGC